MKNVLLCIRRVLVNFLRHGSLKSLDVQFPFTAAVKDKYFNTVADGLLLCDSVLSGLVLVVFFLKVRA